MSQEIRSLRQDLAKLSEMNYSKTTKFTDKQKKMFDSEVKALYDKVEDLIEDAQIDMGEQPFIE